MTVVFAVLVPWPGRAVADHRRAARQRPAVPGASATCSPSSATSARRWPSCARRAPIAERRWRRRRRAGRPPASGADAAHVDRPQPADGEVEEAMTALRGRHRCRHDRDPQPGVSRSTAPPASRRTASSPSTSRAPAGSSTTPCEIWEAARDDAARGRRRASAPPPSRRSGSPTSARPSWRGTARRARRTATPSSGRTAGQRHGATSWPRQGALDLVRRRTGLVLDPYFSGTKFEWLLGEGGVPVSDDLALGTVDAWLIWNLTGGEVFATDATNASRTMLFDIDRLAWDAELCDLLHVPHRAPPRRAPVERPGRRHVRPLRRAGRHPRQRHRRRPAGGAVRPGVLRRRDGQEHVRHGQLRAAQRRQRAAAAGRGHADDGGLDASPTAPSPTPSRERSSRPARRSSGCATGSASSATPPRSARSRRASTTRGGVFVVPAFTGLGSPWWDAYARGTVTGITRGTTRAHLARAVVEVDGVPDARRRRGDGARPAGARSPSCVSTVGRR